MGSKHRAHEQEEPTNRKTVAILQSEMKKYQKSVGLAYVLCIFLGIFGIHKFYLRNVRQGIVYLILGLVSIPSLIVGEFTGLISFGASGMPLFRFGLVCLGILVILLIVDLFTTPRQVRQANMSAENKIIDQLLNAPTENKSV